MVWGRIDRSEKRGEDPVILLLTFYMMKCPTCKRLLTNPLYLVLPGMMITQTRL